jgi:uncharacterized protein YdeI (YjbR/CyaY-like superfamily)
LSPAPALPTLQFKTQKAFETWLAKNHAKAPGVWVQFAKKASGVQSITYAEAVEAALCYGWIDGQSKSIDDTAWIQKYTPRGPKSIWSKINRGKVEALIENGRMKPAGLAAIQSARKDGRWEAAYDPPSKSEVPPDLQAALDASPKAKAFFAALNSANRYAILFRTQTAKKPETRAKRIQQFVEMLEKGEKLYP